MNKNLSASAGGMSSIPGLGRFCMGWSNYAHWPQLLKPVCLEPVLCNKRNHCGEKPTYCNQRVIPACLIRGIPSTAAEIAVQLKVRQILKKKKKEKKKTLEEKRECFYDLKVGKDLFNKTQMVHHIF